MIRAVLFDLDDTLLDHGGAQRAALDEWCAELGLPGGQYERFAGIEKKWFSAYERGKVTHQGQRVERCREFLGRALSQAEALAAYDGYLTAYQRNWRAFDDALPTVRRALSAGMRVGVLTNGARVMQEGKLRAGGLDLPEVVLIATVDLGIPKPMPEAYLEACRQLDTLPGETLMVGDSPTNDVAGAHAAGLTALLLDRSGTNPDADLTSLKDLDFY